MNKELTAQLAEKYPAIFKELGGDPTKTCMSWEHGGISCGDGWYDLLDKLCGFCQWHTDKNGYGQVVAEQVKEKFGSLRFYYRIEDTPTMREHARDGVLEGAISFAECLSATICEGCGKPGTMNTKGWMYCACDECKEKYKK